MSTSSAIVGVKAFLVTATHYLLVPEYVQHVKNYTSTETLFQPIEKLSVNTMENGTTCFFHASQVFPAFTQLTYCCTIDITL